MKIVNRVHKLLRLNVFAVVTRSKLTLVKPIFLFVNFFDQAWLFNGTVRTIFKSFRIFKINVVLKSPVF